MILPLLRLTRPYYSLPLSCGLIVITAYVVGGQLHTVGPSLAAAWLSLVCVLSAAYILNDVCDLRFDAINSPGRMLPGRKVSPAIALAASFALFVPGIALAWLCGVSFFILLVLVAAGLILYDVYSKRWGLYKNIAAAALTTSLYPLAFALADAVDTPRLKVLWIHPLWLFLTALGYEMLKDIRDVRGDCLAANPRQVERCGRPGFLWSARLLLLTASLLTILPYLLGWCRTIYLVSSLTAIVLSVVLLGKPPVKAIPYVYASVFIITAGAMADVWVYGP